MNCRGPCTRGPLDFVHPAHPIATPLPLWWFSGPGRAVGPASWRARCRLERKNFTRHADFPSHPIHALATNHIIACTHHSIYRVRQKISVSRRLLLRLVGRRSGHHCRRWKSHSIRAYRFQRRYDYSPSCSNVRLWKLDSQKEWRNTSWRLWDKRTEKDSAGFVDSKENKWVGSS